MKRALFSVLALVLVLCLSFASFGGLALAQEEDPWVCLVDDSHGRGAMTTLGYRWLASFSLNVSGELYYGWCIDPEKPIAKGWCNSTTLSNAPRETKWCEIAYIMTNYNATCHNESAAIQLAIWKYLLCGRGSINVTDAPSVEARALAIYDDAQGKSVCGPGLGMTLERDGEATVDGGVASQKFTATVTDSGCLEGIAIEFSTDAGSFSPPNGVPVTSVTKLTDGSGKASVTLYWDASLSSPGATVTAHTEGRWPVIIQPDDEEIQPTVISRPCELTEEIKPVPVGGDVRPIDKLAVLAPWIGLAVLLIVGGMVWFRLRRRRA